MASTGCKKAMNAQIQLIEARLTQAEKDITSVAKGVGALAQNMKALPYASPATFSAITSNFEALALAQGQAAAAAWQTVKTSVSNLPNAGLDFIQGLAIQTASAAVGGAVNQLSAAIGAATSLAQNTLDTVQSATDALKAILDADPTNAAKQLAYNLSKDKLIAAQNTFDTIAKGGELMKAVANCKTDAMHFS